MRGRLEWGAWKKPIKAGKAVAMTSSVVLLRFCFTLAEVLGVITFVAACTATFVADSHFAELCSVIWRPVWLWPLFCSPYSMAPLDGHSLQDSQFELSFIGI